MIRNIIIRRSFECYIWMHLTIKQKWQHYWYQMQVCNMSHIRLRYLNKAFSAIFILHKIYKFCQAICLSPSLVLIFFLERHTLWKPISCSTWPKALGDQGTKSWSSSSPSLSLSIYIYMCVCVYDFPWSEKITCYSSASPSMWPQKGWNFRVPLWIISSSA